MKNFFGKSGTLKKLSYVCLLAFFGFLGCSSAPLKMPTPAPGQKYKELGKGTGNAVGFMCLGLIPLGQNDRFVNAYDQAVQSKSGDDLINPVIQEKWFWTPIGDGFSTTISGDVIKKQ